MWFRLVGYETASTGMGRQGKDEGNASRSNVVLGRVMPCCVSYVKIL